MKFSSDIVQTRIKSPLGDMVLAATAQGLAGAWFTDQRHRPESLDFKNVPHAWPQQDAHPVLQQAARQLAEFFEGQRRQFDLVYDISGGTTFQQSVWSALLKIDIGQISSYGQIARDIHNPAAVRAVGMAVGRNPLGILIPCHRVLGKDGSLTGYAGGLWRKTWLLGHEKVPGFTQNTQTRPQSASATPYTSTAQQGLLI